MWSDYSVCRFNRMTITDWAQTLWRYIRPVRGCGKKSLCPQCIRLSPQARCPSPPSHPPSQQVSCHTHDHSRSQSNSFNTFHKKSTFTIKGVQEYIPHHANNIKFKENNELTPALCLPQLSVKRTAAYVGSYVWHPTAPRAPSVCV